MKEGESAEFTCDVYPETSEVVWRLHGDDIVPDVSKFETNSIGKTRHLVIRNTAENDAGDISAVLGDNECHAELKVKGTNIKMIWKYV